MNQDLQRQLSLKEESINKDFAMHLEGYRAYYKNLGLSETECQAQIDEISVHFEAIKKNLLSPLKEN